jgi:hypothetical protein
MHHQPLYNWQNTLSLPIQYVFLSKNSNGNGIAQPHFLLLFNRKLEHTHEGNTEEENNGYVVIKWYIYESAVKISGGEEG